MELNRLGDETDFLLWRMGSGGTVEIFDIQVNSERRKGRGRRLVYQLYEAMPEGTKLVWAITRADNFVAQQFYEELRFRVVGVLRAFYQDDPVANRAGARGTVDAIMFGRDVGSLA